MSEWPICPSCACSHGPTEDCITLEAVNCPEPVAKCKNMKCTYAGMDGERYGCAVCGDSYFLDYEEMK